MSNKNSVLPQCTFFHQLCSIIQKAIFIFVFFMIGAVPHFKVAAQQIPCPPNLGFDFGNFDNWWCYTNNGAGLSGNPPVINTANYGPPVATRHTITSGAGTDQYGGFPIVYPGGGSYSLKLGNNSTGNQAERVRYYLHVPPTANNYSFQYAYAVVFQDPSHSPWQQPRFQVKAIDSATGDSVKCASQLYVSSASIPGFLSAGSSIWYKPWALGSIDLSGHAGKTIIVDVVNTDCALGGHWGYGYFDMVACGDYSTTITTCNLQAGGVTFTAPPGFLAYTWYNSNYTNVVGTTQTVTIMPPTTPTYYHVVMTPIPGIGCPDTLTTGNVADIAVNATPDTLCISPGQSVQLGAGASGGIAPLMYNWTPANTLSCSNCPNPLATPTNSTSYVVTVIDSNGCFRQDTLNILQTIFQVNAGQDFTTCIGTPVQLQGAATPPSSFYKYSWTPATNLSNATLPNPTFTPTTVGTETYIFMVDSSSCKKYDTLVVRTLPNDFTVHDTVICNGAIFQAYGVGDTAFTYTWTPSIGLSDPNVINPIINIDTTRTYTVTANYPTCPNFVKSVTIDVQPVPTVFLGNDTAKCEWEDLPISAQITPSWYPLYNYQWAPNNGISSLNNPNIIFFGANDATLILTVSTPAGCSGTDAIFIEVHKGNFATITPGDTFVCPRNSVNFTVTGGEKYEWIPSRYLDDPTSPTPVSKPLTSIKYTVYVTDDLGCMDTVTSSVVLAPEAVLTLGDSVTLYPGEQYQMDPKGNCLYFTWFPPLGLSSTTVANPIAMPPVNTRYFVQASTEHGCTATDSIDVYVINESLLDVPNAFTPGSAPNDVLKIIKRGQATLKSFQVFNRWGNKVFETSNIEEGWDGNLNGKMQPMGVYVFAVEAYTKTGKRFRKQGNITLIR